MRYYWGMSTGGFAATDYGPLTYEGSRRSAETIVPLVLDLLAPASVVDFGCGTGQWLSVFASHGVSDYLGVESGTPPDIAIPRERFREADITRPLDLGAQFDLAISLEVGEHLPKEAASEYVSNLTRHTDAVLFSAAIPGQGGLGHTNEQWPSYWAGLFAAHGYDCFDPFRQRIWTDESIEFFYRQNMLLFCKREAAAGVVASGFGSAAPMDMVHRSLHERMVHDLEYVSIRGAVNDLRTAVGNKLRRTLHASRVLGRRRPQP